MLGPFLQSFNPGQSATAGPPSHPKRPSTLPLLSASLSTAASWKRTRFYLFLGSICLKMPCSLPSEMVIISYPSPSKALVGASFNVTARRLLRETATVCIPHRHRWQSCYTSFCIWGSCLFFMCGHRIFGSQKGETRDRIGLKSFLDLAYCQFPYWTTLFSDFHWWRSVKKKPRHPHWHQPHHQDSGRLRLGCDSLQGDTTLVKKMPKRIQISSTSTSLLSTSTSLKTILNFKPTRAHKLRL